jgi:flagellar hook-associated protein FlgK
MTILKVKGHDNLVRDTRSNAIINTNKSEYQIYMARVRAREKQGDEIRNTVKEINNLKAELREIKNLIKEVVKK